jgi:hypothetical protein
MNTNLIIALNAIEQKHDVELGVYDDLKVEMKGANIGAMKAIDLANSAKKPAQDSLNANKQLLVKFENFVKQIKALGIENPQVEVEKAILQVKENIKVTESVLNALNKI